VQYGSKRRSDRRIVWKRDPDIGEGFVPTQLWRHVEKIRAPVIYVPGGASAIAPRATQEQLTLRSPQAEVDTMSGLGHYPSNEDAAGFLDVAERFLADR